MGSQPDRPGARAGRVDAIDDPAAHPDARSWSDGAAFPDLCAELASTPRAAASTGAADAYTRLQEDNARLRRRNRELTEHLELAVATIQRLTIDNSQLHTALAKAQHVTRLPRAAPTRRD